VGIALKFPRPYTDTNLDMAANALVASGEKFKVDRRDIGRADTFRYNVLVFVAEENYDRAIKELKDYLALDHEYPKMRKRIERYVSHAIDLVHAVRAKRRFPGLHSLTMSKQQDIIAKFHEHFNELQKVLQVIERIQHELRLEDVRSTALVVKAIVNSAIVIFVAVLIVEGLQGIMMDLNIVGDNYLNAATEFVVGKLNL